MSRYWIGRDADGVVVAAAAAAYITPGDLEEMRQEGLTPELVVCRSVTLGAPLPDDIKPVATA